MSVALITGITGQDGSYLAELLISKNYKVYGIIRKHSSISTQRLNNIYKNSNLKLYYGDCTEILSLINVFNEIKKQHPDLKTLEVYHLAAQSHVHVSFVIPEYTGNVDALGTLRLLEAIVKCDLVDKVKFYNATTSELFGDVLEVPQKETTPFNPQSPYAIAKLYSYWIVKNYRKQYNMFACNGILFNHTSPRRGETFACKKITMAVANIKKKTQKYLELGNIYAKRDLGHAKDYVLGMFLMLQQETPDDFVLSMNETHTIKSIVEMAFKVVDIEIEWKGQGIDEIGLNKETNETIVVINPKYFRPCEVEILIGDSSKAREILEWKPIYNVEEIIKEMVEYDMSM
jgi:GDPmannose 4,6-dehydratase